MINIRSIRKLRDGEGLTLKKGNIIRYKTGWQVATKGIETSNIYEAIQAVRNYSGDCGVWYDGGIYYVDKSHREPTKTKALSVGRRYNQISIYGWKNGVLAYC